MVSRAKLLKSNRAKALEQVASLTLEPQRANGVGYAHRAKPHFKKHVDPIVIVIPLVNV